MQSIPFIALSLAHLNYTTVTLLMTIESSFIPFPSEIVVPPAAYLAHSGQTNMTLPLIILCSTIGAMAGAFINYALARWLGRPLIYTFVRSTIGHLCMLNENKMQQAEKYFRTHGAIATLVGRLVPAVRQLISIPAGLAQMNTTRFAIYTAAGATIWNTILATIGWSLATLVPYDELNTTVAHYATNLKITMIALGITTIAYLLQKGLRNK